MKPKSLYYNKLPHEAIHDPCFIPDENDSDDYLVESKEYSVYDPEIYDAGAQECDRLRWASTGFAEKQTR